MITTKASRRATFLVVIDRQENGDVGVSIERRDGAKREYNFAARKLLLYRAINGPVRDAVDFLLGEGD
jgi:hypothetical protein